MECLNALGMENEQAALKDEAAVLHFCPENKAMLHDIAVAADKAGREDAQADLLGTAVSPEAQQARRLVSAVAILKPDQASILGALFPPKR